MEQGLAGGGGGRGGGGTRGGSLDKITRRYKVLSQQYI